jgi:hypothetical protein
MPSLIDEHQVFLDSLGTPIVSGKIYIGSQNNDPVTNPITIYSDRDLTTALPNPQPTDVNGRALNKIWVPAKYSIRVDDADDVQQYQNLDAGDTSETGITNLTNVAGTDTITAEGTPAILALVDNQQYNFRAAAANTGPVTLQIDLTAAKSIKKLHDVDLGAGDIEANQTVSVIYNATDDTFEIMSNVVGGKVFAETADHVNPPVAGFGEYWVKDDTPNTPYYTDDAGNDYPLLFPIATTAIGNTTTTLDDPVDGTATVVKVTHTARKTGATLMITANFSVRGQNTGVATNDITCDLALYVDGIYDGSERICEFADLAPNTARTWPVSCTWITTAPDTNPTEYVIHATCSDTVAGDNWAWNIGGPGNTEWEMIVMEIG